MTIINYAATTKIDRSIDYYRRRKLSPLCISTANDTWENFLIISTCICSSRAENYKNSFKNSITREKIEKSLPATAKIKKHFIMSELFRYATNSRRCQAATDCKRLYSKNFSSSLSHIFD